MRAVSALDVVHDDVCRRRAWHAKMKTHDCSSRVSLLPKSVVWRVTCVCRAVASGLFVVNELDLSRSRVSCL